MKQIDLQAIAARNEERKRLKAAAASFAQLGPRDHPSLTQHRDNTAFIEAARNDPVEADVDALLTEVNRLQQCEAVCQALLWFYPDLVDIIDPQQSRNAKRIIDRIRTLGIKADPRAFNNSEADVPVVKDVAEVVHYAPYGPNANFTFHCGEKAGGGYTNVVANVTCEGCKQAAPGLWRAEHLCRHCGHARTAHSGHTTMAGETQSTHCSQGCGCQAFGESFGL